MIRRCPWDAYVDQNMLSEMPNSALIANSAKRRHGAMSMSSHLSEHQALSMVGSFAENGHFREVRIEPSICSTREPEGKSGALAT
jgi:hypothetical protein